MSTPLPAMLKAIQDNINPKVESVEAGLAMMGNAEPGFAASEKASRGLVGLLREGKGEPLSIVVDAMIKKLGPGESACMSRESGNGYWRERTGGMLRLYACRLCAVTIVIDEANIAFNVTPTTKDGNIEETNAAGVSHIVQQGGKKGTRHVPVSRCDRSH